MTDATGMDAPDLDGAAADVPSLDETKFIKKARRRSTRRILLLAGGLIVAAVIVLGAVVFLWQRGLDGQSARIDGYCLQLVSISSPNTRLMLPGTTRTRFPGAVNEYPAYRTVGDVVVPVGLKSAKYLEEQGVRYFGVVVCGSPEAALALAHNSLVSAVTLGLVVMPWE
jgi:hypothetical protein